MPPLWFMLHFLLLKHASIQARTAIIEIRNLSQKPSEEFPVFFPLWGQFTTFAVPQSFVFLNRNLHTINM